jgi:hypothetical protein
VDTYLRVHTSWWNHAPPSDPRCDGGSDGAGAPLAHAARSPQTIRIYERSFAAEVLPERATRWGRAFPPRWRTLCERAIAAWAGEFSARMAAARALTLIHGDAHLQNVLLPRDPRTDRPVLIDWEGWTGGLGLWDLAGVLVDWQAGGQLPAEARRDLEGTLLSRYHAGLRRAGIRDYSTQDCRDDYRLCLLARIPHALAWRDLPYLSAAIQAFEDWDGDARRA